MRGCARYRGDHLHRCAANGLSGDSCLRTSCRKSRSVWLSLLKGTSMIRPSAFFAFDFVGRRLDQLR